MRSDGRRQVGIKIYWRMGTVFLLDAFHDFVPQGCRGCGGTAQEGFITFIRGIVFLNEVTHVNAVLPFALCKAFPGRNLFFVVLAHLIPTLITWSSGVPAASHRQQALNQFVAQSVMTFIAQIDNPVSQSNQEAAANNVAYRYRNQVIGNKVADGQV